MKGYTFSVDKNSARFSFINDTGEKRDMLDRKWSHYAILHKLINFMKSRGWHIEHDANVHKIIRKDHWYGKKGDLELVLDRYPRGFSFEFFQNIVFENPHGGRYDFDRFEKMPYQVKLLFLNETRHMSEFMEGLGVINTTEPIYKLATDRIKKSFVNCWHHPQKSMDEFELKDLDGQTAKYSYNNTDRDKKTIYNGQMKYYRDRRTGRLMRGLVYHDLNNMWWVILHDFSCTKEADFHLFDPTPEDFASRRLKAVKKPKEYLEKAAMLRDSSNKELINELKRRGLRVSA